MHQFGLHQHIVDGVDTLVDLYVVNHRGIMDDDWSVVHIEYVNLWHAKRDHIFTKWYPPIESYLYMSWYMNITRWFIIPQWKCVTKHPYDTLC